MLSREQAFRGTVDNVLVSQGVRVRSSSQRVLTHSMSTPGSGKVDPCEMGAHVLCWK